MCDYNFDKKKHLPEILMRKKGGLKLNKEITKNFSAAEEMNTQSSECMKQNAHSYRVEADKFRSQTQLHQIIHRKLASKLQTSAACILS